MEQRLLSAFSGRELRFDVLLQEESSTRFTDSNYRDALLNLEARGEVQVTPPASERRFQAGGEKRALPKSAKIHFEKRIDHGE